MNTTRTACLTLALVALFIQPSYAQRGAGQRGGGMGMGLGGDSLGLATQESVQKELSLSSEQVGKLSDLAEKRRDSFESLQGLDRDARRTRMLEMRSANEAALGEILTAEQRKRLKQISLQQQGLWSLSDPEVAKGLELTDDQQKQIEAIQASLGEQMRGLGQDRQQARQRMMSMRRGAEDKLRAVLTAEQQAKLTEMQGAPFEGELRRGGLGGGRQQRRD